MESVLFGLAVGVGTFVGAPIALG